MKQMKALETGFAPGGRRVRKDEVFPAPDGFEASWAVEVKVASVEAAEEKPKRSRAKKEEAQEADDLA